MTSSELTPKPVRAGRVLGNRYTLVSRIATGGMGEVWRARDKRSGMMVAAKVLRPELTGEEISLSRLRLEAKNTMRARHPNIAMVLDSGEDQGQGWIVMELISGRPLTDFVGDGKHLSADELLPILVQVAYALAGSAQAGIVHRDIKPANILVREDGLVKLTDFGISYAQGQADLTAIGMVMGTAQYLAPEQAMGGVATSSGDLYSLGVIAYEALVGKRPFTGKSAIDIAMAHVRDEVPALPASVPDPLADIVFGLLSKNPADRPPSGTALVRALTRAAKEMGISTAPRPLAAQGPMAVKRPQPESQPEPQPKSQPRPIAPRPTTPRPIAPRPATSRQSASRQSASRREPVIPLGTKRDASAPAKRDTVAAERLAPVATAAPAALPTGQMWKPLSAGAKGEVATARPSSPTRKHQGRQSASASSSSASPSSASPSPLPRRAQRGSQESQPAMSQLGMWIIVGLIALTVVLIIIAMVRSGSNAASPALIPFAAPTSAVASTHPEVVSWLSPLLGC